MKKVQLVGVAIGTVLLSAACGSATDSPTTEAPETAVLRDSLGTELGPISAAIVRDNATQDSAMNLVARVEIQANEMVEFYEPVKGSLIVMGAGAPSAPAKGEALTEQFADNPAGLWSALTGDAEMPASLSDAVARFDQHGGARLSKQPALRNAPAMLTEATQATADPLYRAGTDHAALGESAHLTSDWCDSTYYSTNVAGYGGILGSCPNWDFNVCWNHVTGDGWASHDDANKQRANVCPYRGQVTFKVTADEGWITQGSWTVGQNSYRWMATQDNGCDEFPWTNDCPYIRVDILNASGDGYQFRYQVDDI